ncbi:4282_t:CDS:2 [Diversispora eburnea]|uniref:Small nuclear ribonucleoprotein Sm D3 n=1 Tax=Diversispora eburnea TaxID=1213867 RepID=A0A9N9FZ77_9GLOM|nr:4282_t:CDS:2 [Diversispora eburnea]
MSIGVPIKLLHEAQGHIVTLELNNGTVYRGKLSEAEDNMNVQLREITVTARDGRVSQLDQVYIRATVARAQARGGRARAFRGNVRGGRGSRPQ